MQPDEETVFAQVPATKERHFALNFFAAVFRLINQARRLAENRDEKIDQVFASYPFLAQYFDEMRQFMPPELSWDQAEFWWEQQITAWEQKCEQDLPLLKVDKNFELGFSARMALILAGSVEEDSRLGTIVAQLQAPLNHRRPVLEFLGQCAKPAQQTYTEPWKVCRPLLDAGLLIPLDMQAPRSEWVLKVPMVLWDLIRGNDSFFQQGWFQIHPHADGPQLQDLIFPDDFFTRLQRLPRLIESGTVHYLVWRSQPGADTLAPTRAIAAKLNRSVCAFDSTVLADDEKLRLLGPLCTITDSIPFIQYSLGPGESVNLPEMRGYKGAVIVSAGDSGSVRPLRSQKYLSLDFPPSTPDLRLRYWRRELPAGTQALPEIANRFRLTGGYIQSVAQMAQAHAASESRTEVALTDVREGCRALNREQLDSLAERLNYTGGWSQFVGTESSVAKLMELERRCRYRESLGERLGAAFRNNSECGVRTLFFGPSGTGKTLAAKVLASELEMDIYRVDLAAVINKYIGETEKNLHRILTQAEALDVILLLDEGDALLGSRTDVRSSNDRYANLETNYLLQRLEHYKGIVVITSNLVENIDRAFQRRMDIVVPFVAPQAEQRLALLELHLPQQHEISVELLYKVAHHCALTGGQIRNVVLHAALSATDQQCAISSDHLFAALRSEYIKAGSLFPLDSPNQAWNKQDGGMSAFVSALQNH